MPCPDFYDGHARDEARRVRVHRIAAHCRHGWNNRSERPKNPHYFDSYHRRTPRRLYRFCRPGFYRSLPRQGVTPSVAAWRFEKNAAVVVEGCLRQGSLACFLTRPWSQPPTTGSPRNVQRSSIPKKVPDVVEAKRFSFLASDHLASRMGHRNDRYNICVLLYFSLSRLRLRYWPILLLPHLRRHRKWSRLLFKRSANAECMAYSKPRSTRRSVAELLRTDQPF